MSPNENPTDALSSFEQQLASLRPAAQIDRDQLMFRAGQATGLAAAQARRQRWLLFSTNCLTALAAGVVVALTMHGEPQAIEPVIAQPSPANSLPVSPLPGPPREPGYLALRNLALAGNWNDPSQHTSVAAWEKNAATPSYRQLLEQYADELR